MARPIADRHRIKPTDAGKRHSRRSLSQTTILQTLAIIAAYALVWTLLVLFSPEVRYIPSIGNIAMLLLTVWAALQIKVSSTRYIFLFWCIWFVLGSISLIAQNQTSRGKNYNIDPSSANFFYLVCTLSAVIGVLLIEFIQKQKAAEAALAPAGKISQVFWIPLLIFPLLFIASVILATGTIPLLSGQDFSAAVYEQNYGIIYSFAVFVPVVCVMIWMNYLNRAHWSSKAPYRYISIGLLVFFTISGSIDGKRIISILVIGSLALSYLLSRSKAAKSVRVTISALAALFFYVVVQNLRTGNAASLRVSDSSEFFATIGVEYRDFVYSFENLDSNMLLAAGYDWPGSTLAAATPSVFWTLLGLDKNSFIVHDSARTLMALFNVKLGIRIGLPGELWFYMGWAAPIAFALFGMIIQLLAIKMLRSNHLIYKSIMIVQLVIFMLAVNGQSTFTFGLTLPLLYLSLGVYVVETTFSRTSRARAVAVNT